MARAAAMALRDDATQDTPQRRLVRAILRGLNASSGEIEATAAISNDGLVIGAVLAVAARPTVNLGMVFIEAKKTAAKIQDALSHTV